jgi:hypothetical protein
MNHLTNFYKNKCEQLQEQFNVLQYKVKQLNEKIDRSVPPPPELLRNPANDYYTNDELRQLGNPNPKFESESYWKMYLDMIIPSTGSRRLPNGTIILMAPGIAPMTVSESTLILILRGLIPIPLELIPLLPAIGIVGILGVGGVLLVQDLIKIPGAIRDLIPASTQPITRTGGLYHDYGFDPLTGQPYPEFQIRQPQEFQTE